MARHGNETLDSARYAHADPASNAFTSARTDSDIGKGLYKGIPITLFIIGIIANALLIIYLLRSGRFKSPLFMLITSLAVADLGTCWGVIFYIVFLFPTMESYTSVVLCPFTVYVTTVQYLTSVYHLVLFACLRYNQLVHPLWSRAYITWQAVRNTCVVIWICCSVVQSYFTVTSKALQVTAGNTTETTIICGFTGNVKLQEPVSSIYIFILPSLLIVIIHIAKQIRLKYVSKKSLTESDDRRLSSNPRALTIVVALFYITWIPNVSHLSAHVYYNAPYLASHNFLQLGLRFFTYFNSVLDPFVYCFASKTVRVDMHRYLCGERCSSAKLRKM